MNSVKPSTVLIIEDEVVLQEVYTFILQSAGYKVYTANNGLDGLKQLKAVRPDAVLLDLFMPVMDGKEFLRNIDITDYPATKIVVCTNMSDNKTKQEMLDLGAHYFVLKSTMSPKDLVTLIQKVS